MLGLKKSKLDETAMLRIEIKILREAAFRSSPELANAYRAVIAEIFSSERDLDRETIEFLAELAKPANEAVGVPTFP